MTHLRTIIGHFDTLPNETLVKIFKGFDLKTRLRLRAVCHRWKVVIEDMFATQRYLKLHLKYITNTHDPMLPYRLADAAILNQPQDALVKLGGPCYEESEGWWSDNFWVLPCSDHFNDALFAMLARIYPNLEQLFVDRDLLANRCFCMAGPLFHSNVLLIIV